MKMPSKDMFDQEFQKMLEHFAHVLPAQATIRDFVHHNTLHGFEHLKFEDALKSANKLTGAYGYWPQNKFREQYLKGRIDEADLHFALAKDASLHADDVIFTTSDKRRILQSDIYHIALIHPIKRITACQLKWKVEEGFALTQLQTDISKQAREQILTATNSGANCSEEKVTRELWESCVDKLDLDDAFLHPEQMANLSAEQAEKILQSLHLEDNSDDDTLSIEEKEFREQQHKAWDELTALKEASKASSFSLRHVIKTLTGVDVDQTIVNHSHSKIDPLIRRQSWDRQSAFFSDVGDTLTLRGLLLHLTQTDILHDIVPPLQSYIGNWLDEGFAAWRSTDDSFYQFWKNCAKEDKNWVLSEIPDWQEYMDSLPEDSTEAVIAELTRMDIPRDKWTGYLERMALELPGWSGMFYWRSSNPDYETVAPENTHKHVNMMDYLAVRIIMEHQFARRLCGQLWRNEGNLSSIRGYFHRHHAEFSVRDNVYNQHLPEYLIGLSQQLIKRHASHAHKESEWHALAHMIWTWQQCSRYGSDQASDIKQQPLQKQTHQDGWVLFRLAQHLGLNAHDIAQLSHSEIHQIFACIHRMADADTTGFLLLQAYEHHYREQAFSVIAQNHGRGTWPDREAGRPDAQIIFCMDDREEGFRRHLEYINPAIETLGAAAFFGVVMEWKALTAKKSVVLCPVVVTPVHDVIEVPKPDEQGLFQKHQQRVQLRTRMQEFIHQETQRNLLSSSLLMTVFAPFALVTLIGKIFQPYQWGKASSSLRKRFDTDITTRVQSTYTPEDEQEVRQEEHALQHGFSIEEQTTIVASFLQNNGLTSGFSHFVITMGHYSRNQNNPHTAAYGCGACGGKFSGPNGRVFAAMANHPEVREALNEHNIQIPDDCWFIGAEHDTCNEAITFADTDLLPEQLQPAFEKLKAQMAEAAQHSAHERCRKLASAPRNPNLKRAAQHIAGRATDFSQARPELGHATIACGFVGRRHLSQGTFMDRRCFLISYDASIDPEGEYLERILLSAGPVGAGINLEYYFSSVNNEKYGCGSKIVHNLAGLFGVMEGSTGDLRTGLPLQMIEIHEPMRLQLMVEATTDVLTAIYSRQPAIQQLVGNGWLLLSAKDPKTGKIYTFEPATGWLLWQPNDQQMSQDIPPVNKSVDWYNGHYDHLPPTLLSRPSDRVAPTSNEEVNHA